MVSSSSGKRLWIISSFPLCAFSWSLAMELRLYHTQAPVFCEKIFKLPAPFQYKTVYICYMYVMCQTKLTTSDNAVPLGYLGSGQLCVHSNNDPSNRWLSQGTLCTILLRTGHIRHNLQLSCIRDLVSFIPKYTFFEQLWIEAMSYKIISTNTFTLYKVYAILCGEVVIDICYTKYDKL